MRTLKVRSAGTAIGSSATPERQRASIHCRAPEEPVERHRPLNSVPHSLFLVQTSFDLIQTVDLTVYAEFALPSGQMIILGSL